MLSNRAKRRFFEAVPGEIGNLGGSEPPIGTKHRTRKFLLKKILPLKPQGRVCGKEVEAT